MDPHKAAWVRAYKNRFRGWIHVRRRVYKTCVIHWWKHGRTGWCKVVRVDGPGVFSIVRKYRQRT